MKRNKRWRRLVYIGLALLVLLVILTVVVPELVRHRLETFLRNAVGPVEINHVSLGFSRVEVHGLQILDAATPPNPWLKIDRAAVDVTLWQVVLGRVTPRTMTVDGLAATFELDDSLTLADDFSFWEHGFDFPFERIDIRNAQVEICPAGKPAFLVRRIDMTISGATESIRAEGSIDGPLGSEWLVSARVNGRTLETACTLSADAVPFTTSTLAGLPFVPPDAAELIQAEGVTSAHVTFQRGAGESPKYAVAFSPRSESVVLPALNLRLGNVAGDVVLEDGLLELRSFRAQLAGGRLALSGQLDMNSPDCPGKIRGSVTGLPLDELPDEWPIPAGINGLATGSIDLDVRALDGRPVFRGTAQAALDQATVLGVSTNPVRVDVDLKKLAIDDWKKPPTVDGTLHVGAVAEQVELSDLPRLVGEPGKRLIPVAGRARLSLDLTVPLATLSDLGTLQATGEFSSDVVRFRQMTWSGIRMPFTCRSGVLSVDLMTGTLGTDGTINGTLRIPLRKSDRMIVDIHYDGISVREMAGWMSEEALPLDGQLHGAAQANVPLEDWQTVAAWQMEGSLAASRLSFNNIAVSDVTSRIALKQGRLHVEEFRAEWQDAICRGSGEVEITVPYAYRADVRIVDLSLAELAQTARAEGLPKLVGQAGITCVAQGTLQPFKWQAKGNVDSAGPAIGRLQLDSLACDWTAIPKQVELTNAVAKLFGGVVELSARLPLSGQASSQVRGSFRNLQIAAAAGFLPTLPISLTGTAQGNFSLTGFEDPARTAGTIRFDGLGAEAGRAVVQQLGGTVTLDHGSVDLDLTAASLGGKLGFRGGMKLARAADDAAVAGSLTIRGLDVSRLAVALKQPGLRPLQGVLDVQLDVDAHGPAFLANGKGMVLLRDVRWRGNRVTREIRSRAVLTDNTLVMEGISLGMAEGTVSGQVMLRLDRPGMGTFNVSLRRLQTDSLLAPWPQAAGKARAILDGRFRGQFAPNRVIASGNVRLSQGQIGSLPIRDLGGPVAWSLDPIRGNGEVQLRITRGEIAGGRVAGDVEMQLGSLFGVDGWIKFDNLELRPIARTVPKLNDRLTGRVSGEANVRGRNLHSLDELSGDYRLSLSDSPVLLLPVLNALADTHGIASASQQFSETEIEGQLHRGVVRIDRMTMVASGIHMFVEGTISTKGRLDLDVTADTGELMAVGVAVGLLRPMDLVRRRLIFLHMAGTARRPIVTPDIDKFVSQEVLLFFFPFVVQ